MQQSDKDIEKLRKRLIDDDFAMAFGAGIPEVLAEIPDIERMSDEEVLREAKRRGIS